jgi:hypothetical protein
MAHTLAANAIARADVLDAIFANLSSGKREGAGLEA